MQTKEFAVAASSARRAQFFSFISLSRSYPRIPFQIARRMYCAHQ